MKRLFYLNIVLSLCAFSFLIDGNILLAYSFMLINIILTFLVNDKLELDILLTTIVFCMIVFHIILNASGLYKLYEGIFTFALLFSINIALLGTCIYDKRDFKSLIKPYFIYVLLCLLFVYGFIVFNGYYSFEINYQIISLIVIIFGPFLLLIPFQFLLVEYNK